MHLAHHLPISCDIMVKSSQKCTRYITNTFFGHMPHFAKLYSYSQEWLKLSFDIWNAYTCLCYFLWVYAKCCYILCIRGAATDAFQYLREHFSKNLEILILGYICLHLLRFHLVCLTKWLPRANQNSAANAYLFKRKPILPNPSG